VIGYYHGSAVHPRRRDVGRVGGGGGPLMPVARLHTTHAVYPSVDRLLTTELAEASAAVWARRWVDLNGAPITRR
jgi:hypothetical protein